MPKVTIDGKTMHFPYTKKGIAKAKELKEMKDKKGNTEKMMKGKSKMMDSED